MEQSEHPSYSTFSAVPIEHLEPCEGGMEVASPKASIGYLHGSDCAQQFSEEDAGGGRFADFACPVASC